MTEKRSRVPKFGSWDADEKGPFTQIFESARASKGGEVQTESSVPRPRHSRRASREGADMERLIDATASKEAGISQTGSPQVVPKGVPRHHRTPSSGYDNGAGERFTMGSPLNKYNGSRSPLQPQACQAKALNKVGSSPVWEKKNSSDGSETAGRSRPRAGNVMQRMEDTVDKSAAVPKFGAWDAKDPASAEFTVIFQKARNEKKSGGPLRLPQTQNDTPGRDEDLYPKLPDSSPRKPSSRGWFSCFRPKE